MSTFLSWKLFNQQIIMSTLFYVMFNMVWEGLLQNTLSQNNVYVSILSPRFQRAHIKENGISGYVPIFATVLVIKYQKDMTVFSTDLLHILTDIFLMTGNPFLGLPRFFTNFFPTYFFVDLGHPAFLFIKFKQRNYGNHH